MDIFIFHGKLFKGMSEERSDAATFLLKKCIYVSYTNLTSNVRRFQLKVNEK